MRNLAPQFFTALDFSHRLLGSLGREVYRVELTKDNEYRLYHNIHIPKIIATNKKDFLDRINELIFKKIFIIQQFIPLDQIDQKIYDIRIYVQKDCQGQWTVSGGFSRISFTHSYITNYCSQLNSINTTLMESDRFSEERLKEMNIISLKAAKAIENKLGHLGEVSVDFGLDHQGKPWIIEVNGRPQKFHVKRVKGNELTARTVYLKPLEYACFLAEKPFHKR